MGQPDDHRTATPCSLRMVRATGRTGLARLVFPWASCFFIAAPADAANWNLTTAVQVQETYTDNIALAAAGLERSELVTQLSPGLHLSGRGGRLKADIDAVWRVMSYANATAGTRISPTLSGSGTVELLEKWFYVDALASVSQQSLSPFGPQAAQDANTNANSARVTTYSISPRINGIVGSDLTYDMRYRSGQSATAGSGVGVGSNSLTEGWNAGLRWGNASRLFNLSADVSTSDIRYADSPASSQSNISRVTVYFHPDAHLSLSVTAGRESGNALQNRAGSTRGISVRWQPGPRTSLIGERNLRYFGGNDVFSLNHRFRRAALSVSYSRDMVTTQSLLAQGSASTNYQILSASLTASVADPVQRDLLVRQLLQAQGIAPDAVPLVGFLSNSNMIRQALNVSFAVIGVRNTVTFTASRNDSKTDMVPTAADVLASYSSVLQDSMSLSWTFRASPSSSFTASFASSNSNGTGTAGLGTSYRQSTLNLLWNSQVSQHATGSLGLRRVEATGSAAGNVGYRENAATATFGYRY